MSRIKTCPICGGRFEAVPKNRKYCSPECAREGKKISDRRAALKFYNRDSERYCRVCGRKFTYSPGGHYLYCSDGCADDARRIQQRINATRYRERRGLINGSVRERPRREFIAPCGRYPNCFECQEEDCDL